MSEKNHILNIFKDTGALLEGHFILSSGKHSSKYFQCAKVLQHPEYLTAFSIMIADQFEDQKPDVVISPAIGGIVLGTEVGAQLGCRTIFSERKNGAMVIRRGFNLEHDESVLIVEDVITTGKSSLECVKLINKSKGKLLGFASIIDRSNSKSLKIKRKKIISQIKINVPSFTKKNLPKSLKQVPITTPGSRYIK